MGMSMENLIRKGIEDQTKVLDAILAELKSLNQQIAWQNQRTAAQDRPQG